VNTRVDTLDERIKKLDAELLEYKKQLVRTKPGPAQAAMRQKALRFTHTHTHTHTHTMVFIVFLAGS
jgi:hypothetical protein